MSRILKHHSQYRLKEFDVTPPGGFDVSIQETGFSLKGQNYIHFSAAIANHLEVNGLDPSEAGFRIERATVKRLFEEESFSFLEPIVGRRKIGQYFQGAKIYKRILALENEGIDPLVNRETANERAKICLECPRNTGLKKNTVDRKAEGFIRKKTAGQTTDYDDNLGNCGVCSCSLKVAVHFVDKIYKNDRVKNIHSYPQVCWKRKIYEKYGTHTR